MQSSSITSILVHMLQEFEFNESVMGCTLDVSIIANGQDEAGVQADYQEMLKLAKQYEQRFSRFLPKSELSHINDNGGTCTKISDTFAEVFLVARSIFLNTNGLFNPLLQVSLLGYDADFNIVKERKVGAKELGTLNYDTDFEAITCQRDSEAYLLCMSDGQKLDFGGFLKGYVAQKMTSLFTSKYEGVIVNLGGDIYTSGSDANGEVFEFSIYNPVTETDDLSVPVRNGAMATSGNYKRVWSHGGVKYSHIVDSQSSKNPDTDLVSATVLCEQGATADAYATVAMTLQAKEAQAFLEGQECQYVLITRQGKPIINLL